MARKRCVICGKVITETFYTCINCCKKYSLPYKYKNWPRWLKDLVNMEIKNLSILRIEEDHISFCVPEKEDYGRDKGVVDSPRNIPISYENIIRIF